MATDLDRLPLSGIIRIRDMMFGLKRPYRLDQGDISFDTPAPIKAAIKRAVEDNQTHYVQTGGLPRLRELLAEKLRTVNRIPIASPDEVIITAGGMHGLYMLSLALFDPGDEVILPDPVWPATTGHILNAGAVAVPCALRPSLDWRLDPDELASLVTPRTRAVLLNSPHNPTGGVLTSDDLQAIARIAAQHNLWIISDEAYEDIVYSDVQGHPAPHPVGHPSAATAPGIPARRSLAALPGMYDRTVPVYTFSKSFAMTGLRLGYLAVKNQVVRSRILKLVGLTASNVSSVIQYGAIGGLEAGQAWIPAFRHELQARRDMFYEGLETLRGLLTGTPPKGAFYAFLKIDPAWRPPEGSISTASLSWSFVEHVIARTEVGCIPGIDFGGAGEGYVRFCFSRSREELQGAIEALRTGLRT